MATSDLTTRRLPFLQEFSARDRALAEKAARQQEDRRRQAHEARARRAETATDELRRRLHDLLGPRKSAELREAIRRERLAFRDMLQPPGGLTREYAKQKKASRRKIDALNRQFGASSERVEKIVREHTETLREILAAGDGKVTPGFHLSTHLD